MFVINTLKMSRATLILVFFLLTHGLSFAQSGTSLVEAIENRCSQINQHLKNYDTITSEAMGASASGVQETAYYQGNDLQLIRLVWSGEEGRKILEYYFHNGQLIYAFDRFFQYDKKIHPQYKKAKTTKSNQQVAELTQNKYYFKNEKLFLWLDNTNEIDLTMGTNELVGQGLISYAYTMKDKLKK